VLINEVLNFSTTLSVLNCRSFDFFYFKLTTRLILKFMQNINSFVVDRFINTRSSKIT